MSTPHQPTARPTLVCKNVIVSGRRTSMRMEPAMWDALHEICRREESSLNDICSHIDSRRREAALTASIRVFIISYFRQIALNSYTIETVRHEARQRRQDGFGERTYDFIGDALEVVGPCPRSGA